MKLVAVVVITLMLGCAGTGKQKATVFAATVFAHCTAVTLASVKGKLPTDDKAAVAIVLAAEEVSCVLAGLTALSAATSEGK